MTKLKMLGLTMLIAALLIGCSSQTEGKKIIRSDGQTTVVIESTDSITPEKGAVYGIKRIPNYIAYDFLDDTTTIGYKFSESLFGDDRGVYIWDMAQTTPQARLPFDQQPKQLKLSPDKQRLLYIPDKTGGVSSFSVLNLENWKNTDMSVESQSGSKGANIQNYDFVKADFLWAFNWFNDHEGGVLVPDGSTNFKLYNLDNSGQFTSQSFEIKTEEGLYSYALENSLAKIEDTYYMAILGKKSGIYSLRGETLDQVGASVQTNLMVGSPTGSYIALSSYETDKPGQELWLYNKSGQRETSLYKANFFTALKWSEDGKKLAFSAVESDGRAALYLIDLSTNQLNFLGDYPGYGPNTIAFSPNQKQLLISYLNDENEEQTWETQILTIEKDGGTYNEKQ